MPAAPVQKAKKVRLYKLCMYLRQLLLDEIVDMSCLAACVLCPSLR